MASISHIHARRILDSRGNPTVEAEVVLEDGYLGRVAVPSGASTGAHEAHELRDGGATFGGKDVLRAVQAVNEDLATLLTGVSAEDQAGIDARMVECDGTPNKERLGANALLAVSLATAKAEALSQNTPFFEYVSSLSRMRREWVLPLPLCNLINGGKHAEGATDIQEYMVVPVGATTFSEAVRMASETFHALREVIHEEGYATTVGDEGGFAPKVRKGNREALDLLSRGVERAGYRVGEDIFFALDVAASSLLKEGRYTFESEDRQFETEELIDFYATLVDNFPIISLEDGLGEEDWVGWHILTERLGERVQIVGDDLTVTNVPFLERAIREKSANAILIKPNQIGTLTETIDAVDTAHEAGWRAIISHRSGETEDTTIAHLAVGLGTGQIKTGSLSRSERVAKYNELLRIEEILGERATFSRIFRV